MVNLFTYILMQFFFYIFNIFYFRHSLIHYYLTKNVFFSLQIVKHQFMCLNTFQCVPPPSTIQTLVMHTTMQLHQYIILCPKISFNSHFAKLLDIINISMFKQCSFKSMINFQDFLIQTSPLAYTRLKNVMPTGILCCNR